MFALKHRLWCTHNQCFEQKREKYYIFSSENIHFCIREILLYIAWACLRNNQQIQKDYISASSSKVLKRFISRIGVSDHDINFFFFKTYYIATCNIMDHTT